MNRKIILTGATGFIVTKLCKKLIERGDEIAIFSRNASMANSIIPEAKNYKQTAA